MCVSLLKKKKKKGSGGRVEVDSYFATAFSVAQPAALLT